MGFQDKDFCQKLMRALTLDEGDTNRPLKKLACQKLAVIFGLLFKCDIKFSVFHIQFIKQATKNFNILTGGNCLKLKENAAI